MDFMSPHIDIKFSCSETEINGSVGVNSYTVLSVCESKSTIPPIRIILLFNSTEEWYPDWLTKVEKHF